MEPIESSERSSYQSVRSGPRRKEDRGAALIEFALVVHLLMALLMGMVDFGISFTHFNSVRHGTREGTRRAVVAEVGSYTTCPILGGAGLSAETKALICLTKDKIGLDETDTRVSIAFDVSYTEGDALIICTQYPLDSITGMYGFMLNGRMVHAQVDMRVERTSLGGSPVTLESFQEGGGWAWCS